MYGAAAAAAAAGGQAAVLSRSTEALFQLVWNRNREMKMEWFDCISEQVHPF